MQLEKWLEKHSYVHEDAMKRMYEFLDRLKNENKEKYDSIYEWLDEDEKIEDVEYNLYVTDIIKLYQKKEDGIDKFIRIVISFSTESSVFTFYYAKYDLNGRFFDEEIKNYKDEIIKL